MQKKEIFNKTTSEKKLNAHKLRITVDTSAGAIGHSPVIDLVDSLENFIIKTENTVYMLSDLQVWQLKRFAEQFLTRKIVGKRFAKFKQEVLKWEKAQKKKSQRKKK